MQCHCTWFVQVVIFLLSFAIAGPVLGQAPDGDGHVLTAPELVQTDERTQRAVLRAADGSTYLLQAGEMDVVTGLLLQQVGTSTVILEGPASGIGAGLRLRIEVDGRRSHATWSSDLPPADLMQITPVWRLQAPLDTPDELPEGSQ